MINNIQAIVLAAGKASRFNTEKTKLAEPICGQPMILFITTLLEKIGVPTTLVIGHEKEIIKNIVTQKHTENISFVIQEQQLGTGHALACTASEWKKDNILVINGDMPLITQDIITMLCDEHVKQNAAISFVYSCSPEVSGKSYGRVVKTEHGLSIIEAKDFVGDAKEHCCINAGIYVISKDFLNNYISALKNTNTTNEFYITDLIAIASAHNKNIAQISAPFDTIRGINTLQELWAAEQIKRSELISYWMEHGVRFALAQNVHIDLPVTIGHGSYIGSGVHLFGSTIIGKNCTIAEYSSLDNAYLQDNIIINSHTIIKDSCVKSNAHVGPFAHIRNNSIIQPHASLGNFVEVKNSTVGAHTKARHLAYLGDATIGSQVNIGAGTITCNYNGVSKERTIIKDNAFIGSNNTLIAPITIGENAFTAAGSTITANVPDNALAIARSHQINKQNYAHKLLTPKNNQKGTSKNTDQQESFSFIGARLINHDIPTDEQ